MVNMLKKTFFRIFLLLFAVLTFSLNVSGQNNVSKSANGSHENGKSGGVFRENSIKGPRYIDIKKYTLSITGLVKKPRTYNYNTVVDSFVTVKKAVSLDCVEGWSVFAEWKGVAVRDILAKSEPLTKVNTVIFRAGDGYSTSFPVGYIMKNEIILAYSLNGKTLPPERGFPFTLIAEGKWGYKWIKWVNSIELSADSTYEGYWEKRGYSNDGDLKKDFLK
jgi:DMSO/TMAO reductase YedYZ molybdopterin-dependent catalytic subunit